MQAVVCYGDGVVRYEDFAEQKVGDNDVKISVKACGICGSDIPRAIERKAHSYPTVLGHEFSGIVVQTGKNVLSVKVGEKVTGAPLIPCGECEACKNGDFALCSNYSFVGSRQQGAMAQYVVLPEKNVFKLDEKISFEQGALFEPATVALHAYFQNNYKEGGYVCVLGGGTIGIFAMQWAKILGCKKVVVFGRDKKHLELSKRLGADEVISTLDEDFKKRALFVTDNHGFDYVFECAGAVATIKYSLELAAKKAKICLVGTPTKEMTFSVKEWEQINRKECYLTGSWMSYSAPFPGKEWKMTEENFKNGKLKYDEEIFYKIFDMKDCQSAFDLYSESREKVKGRVLLVNR